MVITKYSLYNFVRRNRINKTTFLAYCMAISTIFYFMMVSIFGDKGLLTYYSLKKEAIRIENEKAELLNKIRIKREMIKSMNYDSLDLDLVDEQSRKILGYVGKDEVVIYQNSDSKNQNK
jgi:cell division protein FtsB